MGRVYSYMRFSDPRQAAGSSADRQAEYAQRWAAARGMALDESLSMRDEGLSAYHQRHVSHGALGVFLRAAQDGRIEPGSVLIVEGLDRLSRAEPLQAQAQLTQIIHAGITVVTASDGQEYSLEAIRANPYQLIHSLVVMIRAHEESDTKAKRVKAAIRRRCEDWLAGTWRGIIRQGRDPQWLEQDGAGWRVMPERVEAVRFAARRYQDGLGGVQIIREITALGLSYTDQQRTNSGHLYKTLRSRALVGERVLDLDGETYTLPGYYPAILTDAEFDRLAMAMSRRQGRRGAAALPSILTGLGITTCGYCGAAIATQNIIHRGRMPDGRMWPGHRRLMCLSIQRGGCRVPGSMQAGAIERALMLYCCDQMRLRDLMSGGDQAQAMRADLARARRRLADTEARLDRLNRVLAEDDGVAPLTVLRQIREREAAAAAAREEIVDLERQLAHWRPARTDDQAARWLALLDGVEAQDPEARLQARELVRDSFARIVIWHAGEPAGVEDGRVVDMEITARGGGVVRLRVDKASGGLVDT